MTSDGEVKGPIVRMNDEVQISNRPHEPMSNIDDGEDTVQNGPEVGVSEESATNAERDEEHRVEHTAEPVQLERRTLLDMFRVTLTTSAVDSVIEKIGGDSRERIGYISVREALKTRGAEAEKGILNELSQMLDKKVWRPVHTSSLSGTDRSRIIRSQMFLKGKFLQTGQFEKLKGRLVAGGDQQDKTLYEDLSSPTVSSSVVMTLLSVAAHDKRSVTVVDITGAYLNAEMGREVTVHMRLDRVISELMTRLQPAYAEYLDHRGSIVVRLQRALYGCMESAALWHEHLSGTLIEQGYERNKHECCVSNKTDENGTQCTVAFHVDDLLITSQNRGMIESLCTGLRIKYGTVSRTDGPVVNYLGMVFDLSHAGEARVSMKGYVEDLLTGSGISGVARSPATEGLFDVRAVTAVTEERRAKFHSLIAKILYLAKRTKPECLTAISFLATRVTKCTPDDEEKLERLIKYIRHTKDRGIVLRPGQKGHVYRCGIRGASRSDITYGKLRSGGR